MKMGSCCHKSVQDKSTRRQESPSDLPAISSQASKDSLEEQTLDSENHQKTKWLHNDLNQCRGALAKQKEEIEDLKKKNAELLIRLSAIAGSKLTDGNANIADLSDDNRPTKLAEQFSELYDNEWTDAFGYLTRDDTRKEEESCTILLNILCRTYQMCRDKAKYDLDNVVSAIAVFNGNGEPSKEMVKMMKDTRKRSYINHLVSLKEMTLNRCLKETLTDQKDRDAQPINRYSDQCLRLCWLMVIQDPPVYMDTETVQSGKQFNTNTHKQYTKSGPVVDFIVWPALYLCDGGSMLSKGVAQCRSEILRNENVKEKSDDAGLSVELPSNLNAGNKRTDMTVNPKKTTVKQLVVKSINNNQSSTQNQPSKDTRNKSNNFGRQTPASTRQVQINVNPKTQSYNKGNKKTGGNQNF